MPQPTQSQNTAQVPTRQQYEAYARQYYAQYGRYPPNYQQYMQYYNRQVAPEPDPGKPVQGKPAPVHHALDHRMIVPMVIIIILVLGGGIGFMLYQNSLEAESEALVVEETAAASPAEPVQTAEEILDSSGFTPAAVTVSDTCYDMDEGTSRDQCYINLALTSFEDDFCEEIGKSVGTDSRDDCYYRLAVSTYSIDYCNMIGIRSGEVSVDACYMDLAVKLDEPDICLYIQEVSSEDWSADACFTEMAEKQGDDVLCSYVFVEDRTEAEYSVEACLAQFGMTTDDFEEKYFGGG